VFHKGKLGLVFVFSNTSAHAPRENIKADKDSAVDCSDNIAVPSLNDAANLKSFLAFAEHRR
jgi:hypothetical protein